MASEMENTFVVESISQYYLETDLADVHFAFTTNGRIVKVPAHKTILAMASSVFKAMFFGPLKESKVVNIVDADVSAFEEFLQFFYLPKIKLTMDNIEAVVRLADKYDVLKCVNTCATFLENKLTKVNMIWGYQLAISLGNKKLQEFCESEIRFFSCNDFKSDIFLQCDRQVVKHILQMNSLICSEAELFEVCIAWAKASCRRNKLNEKNSKDLKKQLGDCFHLIRFGAMTIEEIGVILNNKLYEDLFTKDELADVMRAKSIKGHVSKIFKHGQRTMQLDNGNLLECLPIHPSGYHGQSRAQNLESIWFSSNKLILLGGSISLTNLADYNYGRSVIHRFTVNIVEHNQQTFPTNETVNNLYTGTHSSGTDFTIQPIVIHPNKMYEIRLKCDKNVSNTIYAQSEFGDVTLDKNITIKFHKNPSKGSSGLVSKLHFYRI